MKAKISKVNPVGDIDESEEFYIPLIKKEELLKQSRHLLEIGDFKYWLLKSGEISNASFTEQDIEKVCSDCCDDYTVDINNQYIGKVFQWLINNDYIICKKVDN